MIYNYIGYGHPTTFGSYNTGFGFDVFKSYTTGDYNSFFGYQAGYGNTTGQCNSFFGHGAGHNNTTGHRNSFFGHQAGYTNTTGGYNVCIGYNAGYNISGSNKLYIANSDTNTLIYGDFANDYIGLIDNTSPTAALDINSDIVRLRTAKTPATAGAAGNAGNICWDANYIYICVDTNTWKRVGIATW